MDSADASADSRAEIEGIPEAIERLRHDLIRTQVVEMDNGIRWTQADLQDRPVEAR